MKNVIVLFAPSNSLHIFDEFDDGFTAYQKSLNWVKKIGGKVFVFADFKTESACKKLNSVCGISDLEIISKEKWTVYELLKNMHELCLKEKSDNIIYAWADCPFLNVPLTQEIIQTHEKYLAEYTFADGYPYGFAPEMLACGTAGIIASLSVKEGLPNLTGNNPVDRTCIFEAMKGDINAFEIETVIAPTDWRMYRFSFDCGKKENLIACKKLQEISSSLYKDSVSCADAEKLSEKASECAQILRTVPGFYNIQIEGKENTLSIYSPYQKALEKYPEVKKNLTEMPFEQYKNLVKKIADFSESAVISLSLFGEALLHSRIEEFVGETLKYPGLSVFIETDGQLVTEELSKKIAELVSCCQKRTNGYAAVMWVVSIDSFSKEMYRKIHFSDGFEKAVSAVSILEKYFSGDVYPQFVRMNENEDELENFYRFWSNKENPSKGKLIIQKYNSYAGFLPEKSPCDLSPLERNPDWHLRRDMVILCDGSVMQYKETLFSEFIGNAFTENLEEIWHRGDKLMEGQINGEYDEISGNNDEYYTFNF